MPLKNEVQDELTKFSLIDPCILLFLRKLKHIEIEDRVNDKFLTIERHDLDRKIKIVHTEGENYWKIVKNDRLQIRSHIKEEKRKGITETEIILAFPLKPDSSADTSSEQNLFAYLPVRSYGFRFVIQADFLLPPSREDIYKDQSEHSWNRYLRDNIAQVFLKAVEEFKLDENLKKTYYNFIPLSNEIKDTFFAPVVGQIQNELRKSRCILTESNNWLEPENVFRADDDIRELIPNSDLKLFFNKEFISTQIKVKKDILDALGIPIFGFDELIQCLKKEEWLKQQTDDWFIKLYSYLNSKQLKEEQIQTLKTQKIFRLENNELASINDGPVFTPLDKKGDYGFEKELRVIKRAIFEPKEKEIKEAVGEFLKKCGVQNALPYEIIESYILLVYESDNDSSNWKSKDTKQLLGYIRYIKDNLENYEKESDRRLMERKDPLWRLKKSLYIRINKTVNETNYDHPQNIYLPKTFGNKNNLESLFEGLENISFVHREYIDEIIEKYRQDKRKAKSMKSKEDIKKRREADIEEWREFFVKLGVNTIPKVNIKEEIKTHTTYRGNKYTQRVTIYSSPDICSIINVEDAEKNKRLIEILDQNWNHYKKFVGYTDYFFNYSWYSVNNKSDWFEKIGTNNWLPTTKGTFAKPSEVFLDKPEIKELLGDTVPYLSIDINNEDFIKALGINTEANVNSVIEQLKSLAEQKCANITVFTKLYEFLDNRYNYNKSIICNAFSKYPLIYIPDTTQGYFTSCEVFWEDLSSIFGTNRGYLEKHYSKLESFFVEKLGVSKKPGPKEYADVLVDLTKKENICEKDEEIILKIYRELNNYLNPENDEHRISEEDWWNDFISKPIFWTDKEEFWKNDNNVFVNDNEELYELFKDKPIIAFLKIPDGHHPKIQYFIESTHISYLSKAIKIELLSEENQVIETNLTKLIKQFVPYILRYLYYSAQNDYERLKNNEKLRQLIELKCYCFENLKVAYKLEFGIGKVSVPSNRSSLLDNGNLYIQKDQLENTDVLAIELSKLFGEIRGLDDFLTSLFEKKTKEKIENYLKAKGISELPEEEKEWFVVTEPYDDGDERNNRGTLNGNGKTNDGTTPPEGEPRITKREEEKKEEEEEEKKIWKPEREPEDVEPRIKEWETEQNEREVQSSEDLSGQNFGSPKGPQTPPKEILSREDKKAIGKWGEQYALKCLKAKLIDKYPEGKIEETSNGFTIYLDELLIVEVHWLNAIDDVGEGYDIKVVENSVEEYIEVKSTTTDTKDWFDVSEKQWKSMKGEGNKFHIYRVYNAGTDKAKIGVITNPYEKWQEGNIKAYPIRIKI